MWAAFSRLGAYLAARARAGADRVTLSFGELEALLGRPLPARGRADAGWWRNTARRAAGQADAWAHCWYGWLSVGWEAELDVVAGTVTFRRRDEASP
jgi:hypothetical protein